MPFYVITRNKTKQKKKTYLKESTPQSGNGSRNDEGDEEDEDAPPPSFTSDLFMAVVKCGRCLTVVVLYWSDAMGIGDCLHEFIKSFNGKLLCWMCRQISYQNNNNNRNRNNTNTNTNNTSTTTTAITL